jgi:guanosine-3',5'-bis(diphosphate) 3'-pyrophosphohydrolase
MTDSSKVQRARALALRAHADQHYGDQPYLVHLEHVVDILERFGVTTETANGEALLCAAWLHDTLEDTQLEATVIASIDAVTLDLVQRVTDEPGASRGERKERTYPKIAAQPLAVVLKLADRIANVSACLESDTERATRKLEMYRGEYPKFRAALRDVNGEWLEAMWAHLDGLLQKPIEP